jgi:hypothetical protein
MLIIAEVKDKSPFGWRNPLARERQWELCQRVGDMVSVHTDPRWGGSWEWLRKACLQSTKPILAKGFHSTPEDVQRALDCGADAVLTVGWWPEGNPRCWQECTSLEQLRTSRAGRVFWNSRDPVSGKTRPESWAQAREARKGWLGQASRIRSAADIAPNADAILVGEGLYQGRELVDYLLHRRTHPHHAH